jgi:HTH-type transcriptional regulator/antitoxin HipB
MEARISTLQQLAKTLKALRKNKPFTQAETGAKVGLLPKTLSKLESDPESASLGSLFKLLSALEVELVIRPKKPGAPAQGEW